MRYSHSNPARQSGAYHCIVGRDLTLSQHERHRAGRGRSRPHGLLSRPGEMAAPEQFGTVEQVPQATR